MIVNKDSNPINVNEVSKKVHELMSTPSSLSTPLILPKKMYEPFFMKVMCEFRNHHKIPDDTPPPSGIIAPHKLLSYILDVMTKSMGEEKRNDLLVELNHFKEDLPFDLR